MERKIKLLDVTVMTALMILLAFSGLAHNNGTMDRHSSGVANMIVGKHNNITTLNTQEMHDLQEFMKYNLIHYGLHSGKLDKLQYKADMNFLTWYIGNFNRIPSAYRGITQQNASVMLPIWENESARAQSDVQAVANYEVNQHASQYHINTAYIVNNRLGNLVSNRTTMYKNESANLLVYKYVKNNQSLVYELIDQKGSFIPVDPYIRLNAFTIHWGWGGLISGTSYNMYFNFTTYNNAVSFRNFITQTLTISSIVQDICAAVVWSFVGMGLGLVSVAAGLIVGVGGSLVEDLTGTTSPLSIATNVNTLFNNEWDYSHDFRLVFTLNAWEDGLVPQYAVWGRINPGNSLFDVFDNVQPLSGGAIIQNYLTLWYDLKDAIGINNRVYLPVPPNWQIYAIAA